MAAEFDFRKSSGGKPPVQQVGGANRFDLSGGKAPVSQTPHIDPSQIPIPGQKVVETYQEGVTSGNQPVTFIKNARDAVDYTGPMSKEDEDLFSPTQDITNHAERIARMQGAPAQSTPVPQTVQSEFVNLSALGKTSTGRTGMISGSPKAPGGIKVMEKKDPRDEVDTPTPLHVVNNYVGGTPDASDLTPFDINSLPKKKQEMSDAESEDMTKLNEAVEREMKDISKRIKDISEKQFDELMEAAANGQVLEKPMTEEEYEAQEQAQVEQKFSEDEPKVIANQSEVDGQPAKRIIIRDDASPKDTAEVQVDRKTEMDKFAEVCGEVFQYVNTKVTAKNYFDRVLHARNALMKKGIYGEIWAIVMYNDAGESIAHPILLAKRGEIRSILEINLQNISGIHTLEGNDTVESVYKSFQSRGALYEYIDYLKQAVVVKLPADMPTAETALKLATEKLEKETPVMTEQQNSTPVSQPDPKVLTPSAPEEDFSDAINAEEAASLAAMSKNEPEPEYHMPDSEPEEEMEMKPAEEITDPPAPEEISFIAPPEEMVLPYNPEPGVQVVTSTTQDMPPVQETHTEDTPAESSSSDEEPIKISKSYDGDVMPEGYIPTADELRNDLERELNVKTTKSDDEVVGELRDAIKAAAPSIKKKVDLRNFKISDVPVAASQVVGFSIRDVAQADWVMPNANRMISVRGLSGPDLFSMNPQNSQKNKINTFRQIYGIIYKHITSKKPPTFDEWLKVTRFSDIDHIYAALLRATFAGNMYLHYECPECKNVFIQEYQFEDLVAYKDDAAKKHIHSILNSADSSIAGYDVELSQIADQYVVGLKDPSIWNMVMETAALSEQFLQKYEDLLDTMSFIDSVYLIDVNAQTLKPLDFGYDPEKPAESTAKKITIMADVIRSLSPDNYFDLRTQIAKMFTTSDEVTYQIPATTCPKCKHKFDADPMRAMELLFMRHQLGALGAM